MANEFEYLMEEGRLVNVLTTSTWKELLKSDDIKVKSEVELFKLVLDIANQSKDETKRNEILTELLPCVRFPFMPSKFLVEEVEVLTKKHPILHDLLHEAFRYKFNPKKSLLSPMRCSPRNSPFRWSAERISPGLKVDDTAPGSPLTHNGSNSTWLSATGDEFYSSGMYSWQIKIDSNLSSWIFIGVVAKTWSGYSNISSGYVGQAADSWAYGSYNGWGKTHSAANSVWGSTYVTGDIITINLNMDKKSIGFAKNDTDYGEAFQGLPDEVTLAVTLYNTNEKVSLVEFSGTPSKKKKLTKE